MTKNSAFIILIFTFFGCNNNQNIQNNKYKNDSLTIVNFQDTNVVLDNSKLNTALPNLNEQQTENLDLDPYLRRVSPDDLLIKGERYYFNNAPFTGISAYSKNKIVQFEIMFINGFKEGTSKWFYLNGNIKSEINFKKNKQDGFFKIYSVKGKVIESGLFKDGKKI
jgi:hypothetical protein|tara:strand:+ start:648 stop:1145 length:498 start_codon:yes stop_codon:yes gene_type:complete